MYLNSEIKNGIELEMCEDKMMNTNWMQNNVDIVITFKIICPHSIQSLSV